MRPKKEKDPKSRIKQQRLEEFHTKDGADELWHDIFKN